MVAAAGEAGKTGTYRLSLNFVADEGETCKVADTLDQSRSVSGTIRDGSCPLNADFRFNYYRLVVTESGVAELRATAGAATSLALLDDAGRIVAADSSSLGDRRPFLRPQLLPGRYTLLVAGPKSGADYTLDFKFAPGLPEVCPVLELRDGAVTTGSLSGAASCRGRHLMEDLYRVTLPRSGALDVTLRSGDFTPTLELRDANNNFLLRGAVRADATPAESYLVASLPAGSYFVAAAAARPGGYSLAARFTAGDLAPCRFRTLPVNTGFIALLAADECPGPDGQPLAWYEFQTPADGLVAGFATSFEVDPQITLTDERGAVLRTDDNSFLYPNAMAIQYLAAGKYRLGVRSSPGGETGQYRVDVLFGAGARPSLCQPLGEAPKGAPLLGTLGIASCQMPDETWADLYRLEVAAAMTADILLRSLRFDAFLQVLDQRGNVLQFDDDSGGGYDARLQVVLEPGTYLIVCKSHQDGGYAPGEYLLSIQQ